MSAPDDALYDDAYALTLRRFDAMDDAHDARWATTSARDGERARAAYWKKYRVRAHAARDGRQCACVGADCWRTGARELSP